MSETSLQHRPPKEPLADLQNRFPAEFRHGYLSGLTGENQKPCDGGGYPPGFRGWPLERRNAWFSGWNLGNFDREDAHEIRH